MGISPYLLGLFFFWVSIDSFGAPIALCGGEWRGRNWIRGGGGGGGGVRFECPVTNYVGNFMEGGRVRP